MNFRASSENFTDCRQRPVLERLMKKKNDNRSHLRSIFIVFDMNIILYIWSLTLTFYTRSLIINNLLVAFRNFLNSLLIISAITAERFFRIDRAQEHLHFVMDITSDTLFILDTLPPTPDDDPAFPSPATPSQHSPGDLTTPDIR